MKAFTLMGTLMVVLGASLYLKEDPWSSGRFRVYDQNWRPRGYIIQNDLNPNRYDIFDKKWKREGYLRRDQNRDFRKYEK